MTFVKILFFENSIVDRIQILKCPQQTFLGIPAQLHKIQNTFFSQITLLDTVTMPQSKLNSLFLRSFVRCTHLEQYESNLF